MEEIWSGLWTKVVGYSIVPGGRAALVKGQCQEQTLMEQRMEAEMEASHCIAGSGPVVQPSIQFGCKPIF
jgi:hypothetical protein